MTTTSSSLRQTPRLADPALSIDLAGAWRVARWPFESSNEESLAAPSVDDSAWEAAEQPGKVFYADPEADRKSTRLNSSHYS